MFNILSFFDFVSNCRSLKIYMQQLEYWATTPKQSTQLQPLSTYVKDILKCYQRLVESTLSVSARLLSGLAYCWVFCTVVRVCSAKMCLQCHRWHFFLCFGRSQLVWTQWAGYRCGRGALSGATWPRSMQCTGAATLGRKKFGSLGDFKYSVIDKQVCLFIFSKFLFYFISLFIFSIIWNLASMFDCVLLGVFSLCWPRLWCCFLFFPH